MVLGVFTDAENGKAYCQGLWTPARRFTWQKSEDGATWYTPFSYADPRFVLDRVPLNPTME